MLEAEREGWKIGKCKYCGMSIVWAPRSDQDGMIPLDPRAPIFLAEQYQETSAKITKRPGNDSRERFFVSHFSTCPAKQRSWKTLDTIKGILGSVGRGISTDGAIDQIMATIDSERR